MGISTGGNASKKAVAALLSVTATRLCWPTSAPSTPKSKVNIWPRVHKELLARGIRVGKVRGRRLMQQHGIRAKRKFVVTTESKHNLPVAPHANQLGQGCAGDGMVAAPPEGWADIPQQPWQPILQRGIPGRTQRVEDALIHEQEGQLLGQCTNRELLGAAENGQHAWTEICYL